MSENNEHKRDPRDIERRPPELYSTRHNGSTGKRREAPAKNEQRSAKTAPRFEKQRSDSAKRSAASASAERRPAQLSKTDDRSAPEILEAVRRKERSRQDRKPAPKEEPRKSQKQTEQEKRLEAHKRAVLRQTRKREYSLQCFNIAVIVGIITIITLFLNLNYSNRPKVDEDERRELASIPQFTMANYLDGTFTSGFSAWFNDTVPSRSTFKNFIADFRAHLGPQFENRVTIIGPLPTIDNGESEADPDVPSKPDTSGGNETSDPVTSTSGDTQQPAQSTSSSAGKPGVDKEKIDGDMSGSVFVLSNGQGFSMFGGNRAGGKQYAEYVNELKERVGDDVNVYSLIAPTAGSFYLPKEYEDKMADEWDAIADVNKYLVGVTPVDAYTALANHSDEYIYFRTDHHWTQLGAHYAAEEFAKVAGVPFAPLFSFEKTVREGMLGSLWGYSGNNPSMKKNPDTFTFYKPTNDFTVTVYDPDYKNPRNLPLICDDAHYSVNNSYMVYGGDMQINHLESDVKNGRKLVIIGDSYDNAMFLSLAGSFEDIWVCDMRAHMSTPYFDLNIVDFVEKMGATDVLFCMDTFSAVGSNRKGLRVMLDNTKTVTLPE